MHGYIEGLARGLVLVVVLLMNLPMLLFGFLSAKCSIYIFLKRKRSDRSLAGKLLVFWLFPVLFSIAIYVPCVIITLVYFISDDTFPTSPYVSGPQWLAIFSVIDLALLAGWVMLYLRSREETPDP